MSFIFYMKFLFYVQFFFLFNLICIKDFMETTAGIILQYGTNVENDCEEE